MKNKLIIYEKFSNYWPIITVCSLIASGITFYFYWSASNILLEGYLRLTSFILFSVGVLSLYKLRDGKIEITVLLKDDVFEIQYCSKNRVIHSEEFLIQEIASLKIDEMPNRTIYNDIIQSDRCIRFRRNDQSDWNYLNSINGRVVPLSPENAEKMILFLNSA